MSLQKFKIETPNAEKVKLIRQAYEAALTLENAFDQLQEPALATKARKLSKILWFNLQQSWLKRIGL
jgi:hypothetical protein